MSKVEVVKVNFFEIRNLLRAGLQEQIPTVEQIADMLRYDSCFVKGDLTGVVAYPVFRQKKYGRWGGKPTEGRWESFGILINQTSSGPMTNEGLSGWYTFRREPQSGDLIKTTFEEYIREQEQKG